MSKKIYEDTRERLVHLRNLALGKIQGPATGYASIDRTWLANYPEELLGFNSPKMRVFDYLNSHIKSDDAEVLHYYGTNITWGEFKKHIDEVAKALTFYGIGEGDFIDYSLESIPEYLYLLLASEKIGANIRPAMHDINSKIFITNDYISQEEADRIYNGGKVSHIITLDPLNSAIKSEVRDHVSKKVNSFYINNVSDDERNVAWDEFVKSGKNVTFKEVPFREDRELLSAFTSGSTGEPKENLHTSSSMLGIIDQLVIATPPMPESMEVTWLLTILPPSLIAVVVTMMLFPLASNKKLILDPYCDVEDLDLEMMYYKPNCWALIPYFFENLIQSKRIPDDYDMSHLMLVGFGAEPMRKKFLEIGQQFLHLHNCFAPFGSGYGQSEGGSDNTISLISGTFIPGSAGIPLVRTVMGIFEPGTEKELHYYEIGEVCKSGPGIMKQYRDLEKTKEVLKVHDDGRLWLHTGDLGYFTPEGMLVVLGRKRIVRYTDNLEDQREERNIIYPLEVENKILEINGVSDAVIISSLDPQHDGYEVPYLFIKKEEDCSLTDGELFEFIQNQLSEYEKMKDMFVMDRKPISHFKTDRKTLERRLKNSIINDN